MRSETREKSGRQGKLSTKGHKCNEARIPTNAFYLESKALLPGKQRHDTEIMRTCDQVINLEFDCRVQGGLATAFDLAAFRLSMIAPVKKSVNHPKSVASMRGTGWENNKFVLAAFSQRFGSVK